jgi:uncharacterized protein YdhG (YjbR/CyaY superfamily)
VALEAEAPDEAFWSSWSAVVEVAMKSDAASVVGYIGEQPAEWQPALRKLRTICRRELRGYAETITYGMPSYGHGGQIEVAFGKQAKYLSLYILKQRVLDARRAQLSGLSIGKGVIRYQRPEQIDWDIVSGLLADTWASADAVC